MFSLFPPSLPIHHYTLTDVAVFLGHLSAHAVYLSTFTGHRPDIFATALLAMFALEGSLGVCDGL